MTDPSSELALVLRCISETPDVFAKSLAGSDESTRLRDDLGIDSIGLVGVFYSVIDTLGVDVDEAEAKDWTTLGDVVRFVRKTRAEAG